MKYVKLPKILQPFQTKQLIRLGKNHDGGYLINAVDLIASNQLISFGIGQDISFEQEFVKQTNAGVVAYDCSAGDNDFFNSKDRRLIKKNVMASSNENAISCYDIELLPNTFVKCDIDGHEYDILDWLIVNSRLMTGMVIEFHDICNYEYFNEMTNFISKIDLKLIHIHINNYGYYDVDSVIYPNVIELSFTSSDCSLGPVKLPHELDMPNNPSDSDFTITF